MHNLDTTGWNEYPFEVNGIYYVSKIKQDSPFMSRIKVLPDGVFQAMNRSAVLDLVGVDLTLSEIKDKLCILNEFASHAVIELI